MRLFRAMTAECPSTFHVFLFQTRVLRSTNMRKAQMASRVTCRVIKWKNIISDTGLAHHEPSSHWLGMSHQGETREISWHIFFYPSLWQANTRSVLYVYKRLCWNWRQRWDFLTADVSRRYPSVPDSWHFPAWRGEAPQGPFHFQYHHSSTMHHLFKQNLFPASLISECLMALNGWDQMMLSKLSKHKEQQEATCGAEDEGLLY